MPGERNLREIWALRSNTNIQKSFSGYQGIERHTGNIEGDGNQLHSQTANRSWSRSSDFLRRRFSFYTQPRSHSERKQSGYSSWVQQCPFFTSIYLCSHLLKPAEPSSYWHHKSRCSTPNMTQLFMILLRTFSTTMGMMTLSLSVRADRNFYSTHILS